MNYIPQTGSIRKPLAMWLIVSAGSFLVMLLIVGAPLAIATGHETLAYNISRPFSYLCHQIPARSFFIAEHPFAVCSRCTGIYAGFLVATVAYPLVRSLRRTGTPARKWLFLAALPLAVDFALEFFGIWNNTHFSRFATGALLGAVAVFYVLPGLLELSLREPKTKLPVPQQPATKTFAANVSSAPSDYSAPHRRI
jgi:uncharacterized membrane protein